MKQEDVKNIVEAALMVSVEPLSMNQLLALFEHNTDQPDRSDIRAALTELQQDYATRGVELKEVASGFRYQVRSDYADWINRLYDERPPRYSRALLETLAIIAYRQPITRAEIEDIRGVSVSTNIIRTIQEREWIKIVGHRDVPGRPELLATTKQFLDYFNIKQLSDLPSLSEIKDFDQINPDLFEGLEAQPQDGQALAEGETNVYGQVNVAMPDDSAETVVADGDMDEDGDDEDADETEEDNVPGDNVVPFNS